MAERRGVALVSVLLIVALVSALAWRMITHHELTVAHTKQVLHGGQARHYALGGEEYARQLLHADWEDEETRAADTLLEEWAAPAGEGAGETGFDPRRPREVRLGDETVTVAVEDLGGRFNLNAVAGPDSAENVLRLRRLLESLGLEPTIADGWLDWVDEDAELHEFGAEDGEYLLRERPHRAANRPAADASEMLATAGLERTAWLVLEPHVTALPRGVLGVNVNTAGAAVLAAAAPNVVPAEMDALVESEREYASVETFTAEFPAFGASVGALAVSSEFFEVHVRAEVNGMVSHLVSTIHRDPASGKVAVLRRSFDAPPPPAADAPDPA